MPAQVDSSAGIAEVVYLLVARYQMPEPTEVASQFLSHLMETGDEVPAIGYIEHHLSADTDFSRFAAGESTDIEIRAYLQEILDCYHELNQ